MKAISFAKPWPSEPQTGVNAIDGNTITLGNLETAHTIVEELLASRETAARITEIVVTVIVDEEEEKKAKGYVGMDCEEKKKKMNEEAARVCEPLTNILRAITDQGGSLTHFIWPVPYYGHWPQINFTRPPSFWDALYAHSATLTHLNFSTSPRELNTMPAPNTTFPALRQLVVDANSAHGDDGTAIDQLLAHSPNVELLRFTWPSCDLRTCQITDLGWSYTFPRLRSLAVKGWLLDPKPYIEFLSRNPSIEVLSDNIEGLYELKMISEDKAEGWDICEPAKEPDLEIDPNTLPNLKALTGDSSLYPTQAYFAAGANRPVTHLSMWSIARGLLALSKMSTATEKIVVLDMHGGVGGWRLKEKDSEKKGEDEVQTADGKVLGYMMQAAQSALPEFKNLREFGIDMDTTDTTVKQPDGTWALRDAMNKTDVVGILTILPQNSQIKVLRLADERGEALPEDFLNDLPSVPEGLEYLDWQAKENVLYRIEKEGGKVKAVACPPLRVKGDGEEWMERRTMDH